MKTIPSKTQKRDRRHARIRARISGTGDKPRLAVFKSNTTLYGQLIDDTAGVTLVSSSTREAKGANGVERAKVAGMELAKQALAKNIKTIVFDRGGFIYTGKVKAFAEGAREGGLQF